MSQWQIAAIGEDLRYFWQISISRHREFALIRTQSPIPWHCPSKVLYTARVRHWNWVSGSMLIRMPAEYWPNAACHLITQISALQPLLSRTFAWNSSYTSRGMSLKHTTSPFVSFATKNIWAERRRDCAAVKPTWQQLCGTLSKRALPTPHHSLEYLTFVQCTETCLAKSEVLKE